RARSAGEVVVAVVREGAGPGALRPASRAGRPEKRHAGGRRVGRLVARLAPVQHGASLAVEVGGLGGCAVSHLLASSSVLRHESSSRRSRATEKCRYDSPALASSRSRLGVRGLAVPVFLAITD